MGSVGGRAGGGPSGPWRRAWSENRIWGARPQRPHAARSRCWERANRPFIEEGLSGARASGRWPTRAPWFSQAWASAFPLHTWLSPAEAGLSGRQPSVAHKLAGSEPGPGSGSVLPGAGPVPLSPRAHVSRSVGLQAPVTGPVIRSPPELTVPLPMHLLGPPLAEWPRLCVERLGWPGLLGGKCQGFPCHPPHTLPTLGCLC